MSTTSIETRDGVQLPQPGVWSIDPTHTAVEAVARHLMVTKVRGRFAEVSGTIEIADDPADSTIEVTLGAASITTGTDDRDQHLRSPDFLDVEQYPELTFRSTSIEQVSGSEWKLTGDLTIRGVTRPITLDVEYLGQFPDPWGGERIGFTASGQLEREEWGMTWNAALESGGVLVSKTFQLDLEVQAVRS